MKPLIAIFFFLFASHVIAAEIELPGTSVLIDGVACDTQTIDTATHSCVVDVPPPPLDTDGDGVPDDDDVCPFDPGPASNGGCPIAGGGGVLPTAPNSIAALGCSNTEQHEVAYRAVSSVDKIVALRPLGSLTFTDWGNLNGSHWGRLNSSYEAVWLQLCMVGPSAGSNHPVEHNGVMTAEHQQMLSNIVTHIGTYGISADKVWISGLNEIGNDCALTAPDGDEVSRELAIWASTNIGTNPGPHTGPGPLMSDNCHLGGQWPYRDPYGNQMVEFFD